MFFCTTTQPPLHFALLLHPHSGIWLVTPSWPTKLFICTKIDNPFPRRSCDASCRELTDPTNLAFVWPSAHSHTVVPFIPTRTL